MKKTAFSLLIAAVLLVSASLAEKLAATREYFENLDKETRLEDIVEDLGPYGVKGSGILYHCWHLEDGSEARVIFDSQGRIAMIYINGENSSERIYKRLYMLTESGMEAPDFPEPDLSEAITKMRQAMKGHFLSGALPLLGVDKPDIALYDLTGDGTPDLFTNVTWGSGMVRTDLVAFDPVTESLYILDGYDYDYIIETIEDNRIVVGKEGPHGYGDPVTTTYGTVILENGHLVFIPDSDEP